MVWMTVAMVVVASCRQILLKYDVECVRDNDYSAGKLTEGSQGITCTAGWSLLLRYGPYRMGHFLKGILALGAYRWGKSSKAEV